MKANDTGTSRKQTKDKVKLNTEGTDNADKMGKTGSGHRQSKQSRTAKFDTANLSGDIIGSCLKQVFSGEHAQELTRRLNVDLVVVRVRAYGQSSPMAMTHMQWLHGQRGHQSTDCTLGSPCIGEAWPIVLGRAEGATNWKNDTDSEETKTKTMINMKMKMKI